MASIGDTRNHMKKAMTYDEVKRTISVGEYRVFLLNKAAVAPSHLADGGDVMFMWGVVDSISERMVCVNYTHVNLSEWEDHLDENGDVLRGTAWRYHEILDVY